MSEHPIEPISKLGLVGCKKRYPDVKNTPGLFEWKALTELLVADDPGEEKRVTARLAKRLALL